MFLTAVRGGKAFAEEQKLKELKKLIFLKKIFLLVKIVKICKN